MTYILYMNRILSTLLIFGAITPLSAQQAPAKSTGNIYAVTHVDIAGGGDLSAPIKMLREFAADARKDAGCVRFEVIQQVDRLNHFTIVSVWRTRDAFESHTAAQYTKQFRQKIQPFLGSPFDERLHSLLP